jgi:hypothetical protein
LSLGAHEVTPKAKRPSDIDLHSRNVHAQLRNLAFVDDAQRDEAIAFLLRVVRQERDDVRVAAALALGHLAPDEAHVDVHAQRATLESDVARESPDVTERMRLRWQHEQTLLLCAIATCARAPCVAC